MIIIIILHTYHHHHHKSQQNHRQCHHCCHYLFPTENLKQIQACNTLVWKRQFQCEWLSGLGLAPSPERSICPGCPTPPMAPMGPTTRLQWKNFQFFNFKTFNTQKCLILIQHFKHKSCCLCHWHIYVFSSEHCVKHVFNHVFYLIFFCENFPFEWHCCPSLWPHFPL